MGSESSPLAKSADRTPHRESRVSVMLKDHKDTLAAILSATREQALRHKQSPNPSSAKRESREEGSAIAVAPEVENSISPSNLATPEELEFNSYGKPLEQGPEVGAFRSLVGQDSSKALPGMGSLSSSGTYTPGQLSANSFPSAFHSPLPIHGERPKQPPHSSNHGDRLTQPLAFSDNGGSSIQPPHLSVQEPSYLSTVSEGVKAPFSHSLQLLPPAMLSQIAAANPQGYPLAPPTFPQSLAHGMHGPPFPSWPWLAPTPGTSPSPYEIALMYLQGGPAPPLAHSTSHDQALSSEDLGSFGSKHQFAPPSSGGFMNIDEMNRAQFEQRRLAGVAQIGSLDDGGTSKFIPRQAFKEQETGFRQATKESEGEFQRYGSARSLNRPQKDNLVDSETGNLELSRYAGSSRGGEFERPGVEEATEWQGLDRGLPLRASLSLEKGAYEESSESHRIGEKAATLDGGEGRTAPVEMVGQMVAFGEDLPALGKGKGDTLLPASQEAIWGSSEADFDPSGPQMSKEIAAVRNSLDERPLPRTGVYAERHLPTNHREDPVIQAPVSSGPASVESQKRPFLKRGSRLLKSVIPKRGEKQSWVAEFRGKIAAVPKAVADLPLDEEQMENADWGVLNAQKAFGKRVQPIGKAKKSAPATARRGSAGMSRAEPVAKSGGNFLKAGSRGGRLTSAQSTR
jgi:hypothetical protein